MNTGSSPENAKRGSGEPPMPTLERYEIIELLGKGGMGSVLKARHKELKKIVAIKVLNANLILDETSYGRFEIEAKAGSQLSYPHIVSIFDFGRSNEGFPYIVMEYIEGDNLSDLLEEKGRLPFDIFLEISLQTVRALQYLHNRGIVHRDIKTSNLMLEKVDEELFVKLVDLGIAKIFFDPEISSQKLTETGSIFGSPMYMSPEQCQGQTVDARSDIYSLGCVMYECLNGGPPLVGENLLKTIFMHVNEKPQPLPELTDANNAVSRTALLIHKCLEKQPKNRFQSCAELIDELVSIKEERQVQRLQVGGGASGPSPKKMLERWKRGANSTEELFNTSPSRSDSGSTERGKFESNESGNSPTMTSNLTSKEYLRSASTKQEQAESIHKSPMSPARSTNSSRARGLEAERKPQDVVRTGFITVLGISAVAAICFSIPHINAQLEAFAAGQSYEKAVREFNLGKEHWSSAKPLFITALKRAEEEKEGIKEARIDTYLGRINLEEGRAAEAKAQFAASLEMLDEDNATTARDCLEAIIGLSRAYIALADYANASPRLDQARSMAKDLKVGPETTGDIFFYSAQVASRTSKDPNDGLRLFDKAIADYSKDDSISVFKRASVWIESAEHANKSKYLDDAARRAQQVLDLAPQVAQVLQREELIRRATPLANLANKQTPPAVPANNQPAATLEETQLQKSTHEADLAEQQLEQIKRAEAFNSEMARIQNENFKNITEKLKQNSRSVASPAGGAGQGDYSAPRAASPSSSSMRNLKDLTGSFIER